MSKKKERKGKEEGAISKAWVRKKRAKNEKKRGELGRGALCETTTDGKPEKKRALLSIEVGAGSGSERDDERKGSPLYR